jgi:hypothetical protein
MGRREGEGKERGGGGGGGGRREEGNRGREREGGREGKKKRKEKKMFTSVFNISLSISPEHHFPHLEVYIHEYFLPFRYYERCY